MTKKIICLVRFFKTEDRRAAFLRGDLYMNRLKFFKEYEEQNGSSVGDKHEGSCGWHQPGTVELTIKNNDTGEEYVIKDFASPLSMGLARHNEYHVYCMSAVYFDDELTYKTFEDRKSYMTLDVESADLGDYCAIVPAREFFERLDKGLMAAAQASDIMGRGLVEYFDPGTFSGSFEGDQAIMRKRNCFSHQKEYRIFAYNGTSGKNARTIQIGDLTDIAECCDKKDFHKTLIITN